MPDSSTSSEAPDDPTPGGKPRRFRVIPDEEGMTLRSLLMRRLPDTTRAQASEIIRAGGVYVNRYRIRLPHVRVAPGERVTVYPEAREASPLDPERLVIVHRDPSFVILDKPTGVPVAATRDRARGTLAEGLIRLLEREGVARPYVGVVHRLDQGASGLVLMTTRGVANRSIHRQFVEHRIERRYRLGVMGDPPPGLECDRPLLVRANDRVAVVPEGTAGAVAARTHFTRVGPPARPEPFGPYTLMDAELETGRTHQIRAHAAASGFPIVGDRRYGQGAGAGTPSPGPLLLHAQELRFAHPLTGAPIVAVSALPPWAEPLDPPDPSGVPSSAEGATAQAGARLDNDEG